MNDCSRFSYATCKKSNQHNPRLLSRPDAKLASLNRTPQFILCVVRRVTSQPIESCEGNQQLNIAVRALGELKSEEMVA